MVTQCTPETEQKTETKATPEKVIIRSGMIIPFRQSLWKVSHPSLAGGSWTIYKARDLSPKIDATAPKERIWTVKLVAILHTKRYKEMLRKGELGVLPQAVSVPKQAIRPRAMLPHGTYIGRLGRAMA